MEKLKERDLDVVVPVFGDLYGRSRSKSLDHTLGISLMTVPLTDSTRVRDEYRSSHAPGGYEESMGIVHNLRFALILVSYSWDFSSYVLEEFVLLVGNQHIVNSCSQT